MPGSQAAPVNKMSYLRYEISRAASEGQCGGGCGAAKQNAYIYVAALQPFESVRRTPGLLRSPGATYVTLLPRLPSVMQRRCVKKAVARSYKSVI